MWLATAEGAAAVETGATTTTGSGGCGTGAAKGAPTEEVFEVASGPPPWVADMPTGSEATTCPAPGSEAGRAAAASWLLLMAVSSARTCGSRGGGSHLSPKPRRSLEATRNPTCKASRTPACEAAKAISQRYPPGSGTS